MKWFFLIISKLKQNYQKTKKKKSIAVFDFDVKIDWTERYTDCGLTLHFVIHFSF